MEEALALNVPAYVLADFDQQQEQSFLQVDHNNVLIDSVKKAEADEAIVVRLYEYHNRKTTCRLAFSEQILGRARTQQRVSRWKNHGKSAG